MLVASVSFVYGLVTAIASELPRLEPGKEHRPERLGYIYASDGKTVLAVLRGSESRIVVRSEEIAPVVKQAIVAVEDRRFWEHRGVDIQGMARALWADIQHKKVVQGGSTITQQFIKNQYTATDRTVSRKLKEAALAWQLEQEWSKDKILTEYLNTIYFGNGAYGIQQAALTYFKHGASTVTLPEAALLAGIPSDPGRYDPVTNPRAARARRELVLRLMREQGLITRTGYRKAVRAPLPKPGQVRLPGTRSDEAPYFVNYVLQQLVDKYGTAKVFGGGLKVGRYFRQLHGVVGLELEYFGHTFSSTAARSSLGGTTRFTDTNFHSLNSMVNALLRYPGTHVQPYIGIGGGFSTAHDNGGTTQAGGLTLSGEARTTSWAYQLIGGLRVMMTPRVFLFSEYRYFRADYDWGIRDSGLKHSLQFQAHHLAFGVGAKF
jgi:opacity protein-like surface antigen